MFEIIVKLNDDWIDISGVPDAELFKALSIWSNGKEEFIKIGTFTFRSEEIIEIRITR